MSRVGRTMIVGIAGLGLMLLAGCDLSPKTTTQTGYRGAGLDEIVDRRHLDKAAEIPAAPYPLPPDGGPTASTAYANLKVLGGLSKERFDHLMVEMNQWAAPPAQGCNYCHNPKNMASDEKYTKIVARRMLQMTMDINARWSSHVKATGVTCYTCHRGNAVPAYRWAIAPGTPHPGSILDNKHGQNTPDPSVGYSSLPYDPFAAYLDRAQQIRVAGDSPFPSPRHVVSIADTEKTYGLMMHFSTSLGVNCTYCHNSQSFQAWNLSRAQRVTAYYGIRMVRDINEHYITSLASVFPSYRRGPLGDPFKVNCASCHQGQSKPLGGVSMLDQAPVLRGPSPAALSEGVPGAATAMPVASDNPVSMTGKK